MQTKVDVKVSAGEVVERRVGQNAEPEVGAGTPYRAHVNVWAGVVDAIGLGVGEESELDAGEAVGADVGNMLSSGPVRPLNSKWLKMSSALPP